MLGNSYRKHFNFLFHPDNLSHHLWLHIGSTSKFWPTYMYLRLWVLERLSCFRMNEWMDEWICVSVSVYGVGVEVDNGLNLNKLWRVVKRMQHDSDRKEKGGGTIVFFEELGEELFFCFDFNKYWISTCHGGLILSQWLNEYCFYVCMVCKCQNENCSWKHNNLNPKMFYIQSCTWPL